MRIIVSVFCAVVLIAALAAPAAAQGLEVLSFAWVSQGPSAGLASGDRILRYDGAPVESAAQLRDLVDGVSGRPVPLTVERDGQEVLLTVQPGPLGVYVRGDEPPPADCYEVMIQVSKLSEKHQPAAKQLQPGDWVVAYDGKPVPSARWLINAVTANTRDGVPVQVVRDNELITVTVNKGKIGIHIRNVIIPCQGEEV